MTILNYLQEKIDYATSTQRKEILGEIQDIMHYVLDEGTVAYRKEGENVIISNIKHWHQNILRGLCARFPEYVYTLTTHDLNSCIITDMHSLILEIIATY